MQIFLLRFRALSYQNGLHLSWLALCARNKEGMVNDCIVLYSPIAHNKLNVMIN